MGEDEAVHKKLSDSLVRAATIASSLEAEQDSGNITKTRSKTTPNESSLLGTTSGGGPRCQETIGDTIAQTRFENVSKLSNDSLLARVNTLRSDEDRLKHNELMELCTTLQKKVLDLEKTKTTQANEIASLKRRVESFGDQEDLGEDASKHRRRINAIDADEDITLVNVQDDADNEMFNVNDLNSEEMFVVGQNENVVEEVVNASQDSTAATTVTITTKEITLAQALEALKTSKPKVKGIVFQEPSKSITTIVYSQQSQDKGKGIMIEEPVKPMKKKVQIMLDEEVALKLQAEFDEEERLAREKAKKEKEANIALIEEWDDIQEKIDADYQLAKRLQAEDQEELSIENNSWSKEESTLLLKNMEGNKFKDLKNKSFDSIQKMFDRAFKRVNIFVDFRTDLVEDEEEVAIDVVPLATKPPTIKLVKAKYGSTRLVEDMDLLLWGDLKTMFESHVEDEIWKLMIYMLVEKRYPLTPPTITDMLNKKLQYKVNAAEGVNAASEEVSTADGINTKNALWIYWIRGDDEEVKIDDELSNPGDGNWIEETKIAEIFKNETNIFQFETPLCEAFKEFNYLLKIDVDILTNDIPRFKTYNEYKDAWIYEWNKDVPWVANMPWLDYGTWMEPRVIRIRDEIYFKSYECYENLEDGELKDEALNCKAILKESMNMEEESSDNARTHCSPSDE
ncbi:hypothetical protein Tco_0747024 [Tanacetum coccineum]